MVKHLVSRKRKKIHGITILRLLREHLRQECAAVIGFTIRAVRRADNPGFSGVNW